MRPVARCIDCGAEFPNTDRIGHCASCHRTFASSSAFDKHRVGKHGTPDRRCELGPLHWRDLRGIWHYGKRRAAGAFDARKLEAVLDGEDPLGQEGLASAGRLRLADEWRKTPCVFLRGVGHLQINHYRRIWNGTRHEYLHRALLAYRLGHPVPSGLVVDHLCGSKDCGNPFHLEAVTARENSRRWAASLTHCRNAHENTLNGGYSGRRCRTCLEQTRQRAEVRRAARDGELRTAPTNNSTPMVSRDSSEVVASDAA